VRNASRDRLVAVSFDEKRFEEITSANDLQLFLEEAERAAE
jgi:hypothetical protein